MSDVARIVAVIFLVLGTGIFVVAEYSLVTARRWRLAQLGEGGSRGALAALRLMDEPLRFIGLVQLGISALAILLGALGEPTFQHFFDPVLATALSFLASFALMTYLAVTLGELVPKSIALNNPERVAVVVAIPIELLLRVAYPFVWLMQTSAAAVLRLLGLRPVPTGVLVATEADLRGIVEQAEHLGVIEEAEEEMLYNVFDFADEEVRTVMVPRPEVTAISADLPMRDCLAAVIDSPYTRHPVFRGSIDHVIGILHIREIFSASYEHRLDEVTMEELIRPAYVVPETKDLGALLRELRRTRQPMAIVLDEYGGTVGIVTLEDLLEEIVGEIADEYDLPDESVTWVDDRTVRVAGTFTIDDFNEEFGLTLSPGAFHTLAGLIFDRLGREPRVGDRAALDHVGFRVLAVEGPRVKLLEARFEQPQGQEMSSQRALGPGKLP
jgi:magnesium and cobalt exporter, CNNM family